MKKLIGRNRLLVLVLCLTIGGVYLALARDEAKPDNSSLVAIDVEPPESARQKAQRTATDIAAQPAVNFLQTKLAPKQPQDIMERALAAQKSSDPIEVYAAFRLVGECQGVLNMQEQFQLFAAGPGIRTLLGGQYSEVRRKAVEVLLARCGKFIQAGKVSTARLATSLKIRGKQLAEDFLAEPKDATEAGRRNLRMIQSGDPVAIDIGLTALLSFVNVPDDPSEPRLSHIVSLSMMGAVCDLGVDCSIGGAKMATMCALSGICDLSWTDFLISELAESEKPQFYRAKEQYINWLKSLDSDKVEKLEFKMNG